MKLKALMDFIIQKGMETDPRPESEIKNIFADEKKKYDRLSKNEKEYFDTNKLESPYADSRILYGDENTEVKSVIIGIDIDGPELLLADKLKSQGKKIDLAITHHPEGKAYATFYR